MIKHFVSILLLSSAIPAADAAKSSARSPLAFEPNRGQWDSPASFGTHAPGFTALFSTTEVTYLLQNQDRRATVKTRWEGSSATPARATGRLQGVANYYFGNDKRRWISGLPTYEGLRAEGIYPGIDVIYYGHALQPANARLEYDLELAPGADPRRLVLVIDGATARVNSQGDLILDTPAGPLIQHRPVAYQESHGNRIPVEVRFLVGRSGEVKFVPGAYDRHKKLVIDPAVSWVAPPDAGAGIALALDPWGNIFMVGTGRNGFTSCDFQCSASLTEFSPDGKTILYTTLFDGVTLSSIAVDNSGNAILAGSATRSTMSTLNAYQPAIRGASDAFVAKFDPSGVIIFATFLGGSASDQATGVAVNPDGDIYVVGTTLSSDFPTTPSAYPASSHAGFLTKLSADGSRLVFSTYFAGSPTAIARGPDGSLYVAANVWNSIGGLAACVCPISPNAFQTTTGNFEVAYISRLSGSDASLIYGTYLGGSGVMGNGIATMAFSIDVDSGGLAHVAGITGTGFPIVNGLLTGPSPYDTGYGKTFFPHAFLAKVASDGSSLEYSTYLDGTWTNGVRVDSDGNMIVVGSTSSPAFPTIAAFHPEPSGRFVIQLNPAGDSVLFGSYLDGSPYAVAVGGDGAIYIAESVDSTLGAIVRISGSITSIPVTINTDPPGLQVTVDHVTVTAPHTFLWAPGVTHQLAAPTPQAAQGPNVTNFISWSNGGSNPQNLRTPAIATDFTATFETQVCEYTFGTPDSTAFGQAGGGSGVAVITQAGCSWTASTSAPWITLRKSNEPSGPGTVYYSVQSNPAGGTRSAAITAGSSTFKVTQDYMAPTVAYSNLCIWCRGPNLSGDSQTFLYTVTDFDGVSDIAYSKLVINSSLDSSHACYLNFDHVNQTLYLANDDGTWLDAASMPFFHNQGAGVITNSQCSVNGAKTFVSTDAFEQSTVTIALTFSGSFSGKKVVYATANDNESLDSGWRLLGIWNVP